MFWRKKNKVSEEEVLEYVRNQAEKQRERDILEAKVERTQEIENRKTNRQVEYIQSGGLFGIIGKFIKNILMIPIYLCVAVSKNTKPGEFGEAYEYFTPIKLAILWVVLLSVLTFLAS